MMVRISSGLLLLAHSRSVAKRRVPLAAGTFYRNEDIKPGKLTAEGSRVEMSGTWTSPEYAFRVPVATGGGDLQEIVIDVTLSAPPFGKPSAALREILNECIGNLPRGAKILDFGAGRLRNALYLLQRGVSVCGVEFKKLASSEGAEHSYRKATGFEKFWTLSFPHEFLKDSSKFDMILLINVLNIMPVEGERFLVLQECYKKLKEDGKVLWYSQYGDAYYKNQCTDANRLGDGYYLGTKRRLKTFYREFSAGEIDGMMLANGFDFVKSWSVAHNQVRFFRKALRNPFSRLVKKAELRRAVPFDESIQRPVKPEPKIVRESPRARIVAPNPVSQSIETQLISALQRIPAGHSGAREYHLTAKSILEYVLVPSRLRHLVVEQEIFEGRKRIDIHAATGREGFFHSLNPIHEIFAPYIVIECKNYNEDPVNPEFDQLAGRFHPQRGYFGILVCRQIGDRQALIRRCKDSVQANDYIIVLEDSDLKIMLELRRQNDLEGIDTFFEDRLEEILL